MTIQQNKKQNKKEINGSPILCTLVTWVSIISRELGSMEQNFSKAVVDLRWVKLWRRRRNMGKSHLPPGFFHAVSSAQLFLFMRWSCSVLNLETCSSLCSPLPAFCSIVTCPQRAGSALSFLAMCPSGAGPAWSFQQTTTWSYSELNFGMW